MTPVALILAVLLSLLAVFLFLTRKQLAENRGELARAERERDAANRENQELRPYRTIVDVDARVRELLAEAESQRDGMLGQANQQAGAVLGSAQSTLRDAEARRDQILGEAEARGDQVLGSVEYQSIASSVSASRAEQEKYKRVVEALKNTIEGYGDRYIIHQATVLDELAESFGFDEAGVRLKAARERVRSLMKNGQAADSEYVEPHRRQTAISFILDAFNGKVDSILADVKEDNYGTLRQKVRDAFSLVNNLGEAFRSARILPEYLTARDEELRAAVVVQEAKLKASPAVKKAFESLTPGRQRGYLLHFGSAKQSATRTARIEKNLMRILAGLGIDD